MTISYAAIRPLTPNFDAEVKSYYGKATVWDSGKNHYLFSYGKLTAEIVEGDAGHKVLVYDFLKEPDLSYNKARYKAILRHVAEFLHEYGYSADTFEEVKRFMPPAESASLTPLEAAAEEVIAETPAIPEPVVPGKWILHTHPRNKDDVWFTCSECGNLASADNGKDILTPFCPNCGKQMSVNSGKESPAEISSAESAPVVKEAKKAKKNIVSEEVPPEPTEENFSWWVREWVDKRITARDLAEKFGWPLSKMRYRLYNFNKEHTFKWYNFVPGNVKILVNHHRVFSVKKEDKPYSINLFSSGKWKKVESIDLSHLYNLHKEGRVMFAEIPAATASA